MNRRSFLKAAAATAVAPAIVPSSVFARPAPSDTLQFGCIGVGRQGQGDMQELIYRGLEAGARVAAVCDVDSHRMRGRPVAGREDLHGRDGQGRVGKRQGLPRLPRAPGPQGHRRRPHRHARLLARRPRHRRGRGGQGHLSRKAADLFDRRGPQARRGGPEEQARPPGRLAAALLHPLPHGLRARPQRPRRQAPDDPGLAARGPGQRRPAPRARAAEPRLRRLDGPDGRGALHRGPRPSPDELRAARLAPDRAVLPGHDHRLGLAHDGHRPVGPRHRPRPAPSASRPRPSSPTAACSTSTRSSRPRPSTRTASG